MKTKVLQVVVQHYLQYCESHLSHYLVCRFQLQSTTRICWNVLVLLEAVHLISRSPWRRPGCYLSGLKHLPLRWYLQGYAVCKKNFKSSLSYIFATLRLKWSVPYGTKMHQYSTIHGFLTLCRKCGGMEVDDKPTWKYLIPSSSVNALFFSVWGMIQRWAETRRNTNEPGRTPCRWQSELKIKPGTLAMWCGNTSLWELRAVIITCLLW